MSVEETERDNTASVACGYPCELTVALEKNSDTKAVGTREPLSLLSSSDLNVGYGGSTSTGTPKVGATEVAGNAAGCGSKAPETPQRVAQVNPGTPLTPMANLKVLIAAASSAFERERAASAQTGDTAGGPATKAEGKGEPGDLDESKGRKMKSLAVLCKKFLSVAASNVGVGNDFSLEMMAQSLGTNRRRIYDIINVLEALEMIVKQSKNWYTWLGSDNMLVTLAKMRAMAQDDPEFCTLLDKENSHTPFPPAPGNHQSSSGVGEDDPEEIKLGGDEVMSYGSGRWDKSLGVLCQKFVMLFLVTPEHEVTLDYAGNVLMPDIEFNTGAAMQPTNPKTKVRRLYDIANVLTTVGLIKKKTFLAPNHRKMPGYAWAGPSIAEIQTIPVFRKTELNLYPFYSKKIGGKGGVTLTRRPSFGAVRPFLHQYGVKPPGGSEGQPNSAPTTPMKSGGGFKRSLSFGAGPSRGGRPANVPVPIAPAPPPLAAPGPSTSSKGVVVRPLCPKQLSYLHEVQEFEAEVQKHSHKYPHVASVFHEFIRKYQSSLEQAAASGRSILPKPPSSSSAATAPNVPVSIKPSFSPGELARSILGLSSTAMGSTGTSVADIIMSTTGAIAGNISQPVGQICVTQPPSVNSSNFTLAGSTLQTSNSKTPLPVSSVENDPTNVSSVAAPKEHATLTSPPSTTHGTLMSPGDKSQTFLNVEEVLVYTDNNSNEKASQSEDNASKLSVQPKVQVQLPYSSAAVQPLPAVNTPVQQAIQLLGSLVNQKPILASSAFQGAAASSSQLEAVTAISTPSLIAATIPPGVVHSSQPAAFNPGSLLADPTTATTYMQCANLYYNPTYPVTTSLFGIPPLYGATAVAGAGGGGHRGGGVSSSRSQAASLGKKLKQSDHSESSPPKRPRLE